MPKNMTDADRAMGSRIATLRKAKGLSQTDLGNALGVTFQQVQKYEKGVNRLAGGKLRVVADLLGVRLSDLFGGGDDQPNGGLLDLLAEPGAGDMLRAYAALGADERRALLVLARRSATALVPLDTAVAA